MSPAVWDRLKVRFAPHSAVDNAGHAATQAAIIPVPPDRLPAPLPPGQSPQLVVSIQALGATSFDVPAPITYPNLDNLAPGTQALIWSFNHDAGRWDVIGTGTVSADGTVITSGPGVGIRAPGWHFVIAGTQAQVPIGGLHGRDNPSPNCGQGPDSRSNDYPDLSTVPPDARRVIDSYLHLLPIPETPALWRLDMITALGLLGGGPGINLYNHFIDGSGADYTDGPGTLLSDLAKNSNTMQGFIANVKQQVHDNLQTQANTSNVVDNRNIDITTNQISFNFFGENEGIYTGFLKSDIGGTQGNEVDMTGFNAQVISYSTNSGGSASYSYRLHIDICDEFGVDFDDILGRSYYRQPFNPLIPFWLLQHHTDGPKPFVHHIIFDTDTITDTFTIPPGYQDVQIHITAGDSPGGGSPSAPAVPAGTSRSISTVPGFGSDPSVYYRFVFNNGLQVTGKFNPADPPNNLVLPPNRYFTAYFYQPSTNSSTVRSTVTDASGMETVFAFAPMSGGPGGALIKLDQFGGVDSTGDGLPDIGRYVLGLTPGVRSFAGDGIDDAAKLAQGLNPLDGRAFPTGVISSLPLTGTAQKVAVSGNKIYVATGSNGLAIVDGTQFNNPILLGQLRLTGNATDVGVDANLQIAAVATGAALQVVDVSDGMMPKLLRSVAVPATRVVVADGLAYATSGTTLKVVDLVSGDVLQGLTLPGSGTVTGLAREGTTLYDYVSGSGTFSVVDISTEGEAAARGQLNVSIASFDVGVFVGNGVAWLAGSGLRTINVSDPTHPTLIHGADVTFTARRIALNGSGLGVLAPDGNNFIEIYDTSNPNSTANRLLQIPISGGAQDVAISRGIAYVADGNRLEVVNYLPFDNRGQPPTATISTSVADVGPNTPGIQVFEGTTIPVRADVSDDVQVRDVQLLLNGQVVQDSVSFPFDFFVPAPAITANSNTFTLQLRATDTGGNSSLSNTLVIGLVRDTFPPTVLSIDPAGGSSLAEGEQTFRIRFSKPLAANTVTSDNVQLRDSTGKVLVPSNFQLRDNDQIVQFTVSSLLVGSYSLTVNGAAVTDRAGNPLGANVVRSYTVAPRATLSTTVASTVYEGTTIPLSVTVNAGVTVANVALLVNGQVARNATSGPFEFAVVAPNISPETNTLTIQARVTDTSGLTTVTNTITIGLLRDTTPPVIVSTVPPDGGSGFQGLRAVQINFSKPIATASVTAANFQLFEAGPSGNFMDGTATLIPISGIQFLNDDQTIQLTTPALDIGLYQLVVHKDGITDRPGNPLGAGTFQSTFTLQERLLVNGDFETGDLTGWTFTPASSGSLFAVNSVLPHSGNYAASFGGVTAGSYDTITQTITTVPGRQYTLDYWLANDREPANDFRVMWGSTLVQDILDAQPFGYTHYTFTETATSTSTTISFAGYQVPGYFYLDDVSVTALGGG
jgi:hypothetical protein